MSQSEKRKLIKQRSKIRTQRKYISKTLSILENYKNITDEDIKFIREWYEWDYEYIKDITLNPFPSSDNKEMLYSLLYFFSRKKTLSSDKLRNFISTCIGNNDAGKCYNLVTGISPKKCPCGSSDDLRYRNYYNGFDIGCNTTTCSYFQQQAREGVFKKYGVDNVFKCEEIKEKSKKTSNEKYGTDNPASSNIVKEKIVKTNMLNLGCKYPMQSKKVVEKRRQNSIDKTGVSHHNKLPEPNKKRAETCNKKHGKDSVSQRHLTEDTLSKLKNKEWLAEQIKLKSAKKIAEELGCNVSNIHEKLKKYEIIYKSINVGEEEIKTFLESNNINFIQNDIQQIKPKELDFYLQDYNIGIEFNGVYWHSEMFVDNNYHLNMYLACKEKGIRLISINEDEWNHKSDIIKNKILSLLGKSEKGLPGRKLHISEITSSEANDFCEKYHIQGKTSAIIYSIGAFDENNILIGIMSFSKQRTTGDVELIRFCHDGKIHNGLFSKMLKYSINHNTWDTIISFADLRYSDGNLYKKTGFVEESIIKPDYKYVYNKETFHKFNFKKDRIMKKFNLTEEYVNSKTERELMEEQGYVRLYDIGKIKYVMNL